MTGGTFFFGGGGTVYVENADMREYVQLVLGAADERNCCRSLNNQQLTTLQLPFASHNNTTTAVTADTTTTTTTTTTTATTTTTTATTTTTTTTLSNVSVTAYAEDYNITDQEVSGCSPATGHYPEVPYALH